MAPQQDCQSANFSPISSRLLHLPAELRIDIFEHLLIAEARRIIYIEEDPREARHLRTRIPWNLPCIALLRTCKQIYHETFPILYGGNTYGFKNFDRRKLDLIKSSIGSQNLSCVRKIRIVALVNWDLVEHLRTIFTIFPRLHELTITPNWDNVDDPHLREALRDVLWSSTSLKIFRVNHYQWADPRDFMFGLEEEFEDELRSRKGLVKKQSLRLTITSGKAD